MKPSARPVRLALAPVLDKSGWNKRLGIDSNGAPVGATQVPSVVVERRPLAAEGQGSAS